MTRVASGSKHEPLSHVDAAWLRMDTPTNPMMITSLIVYREPVSFEALEKVVRERLLVHERFRRRVGHGVLAGPHWEDDPYFDLANHLHRVALPEPGDRGALQSMVGDLMSSPLDRNRPLWQLHLVEGFQGRTALITRLHHCMGDGVALVAVLLGMTEEGQGLSPQQVGLQPDPAPDGLKDRAKAMASQAATLGRILLLPSDPPSPFKGEMGVRKRAAWSDPLPLERVKAVGKALGAKVNDVLVACLAGALRSYAESRGSWPEGRELRALVPIYLQSPGHTDRLGNHFGLVFLTLPMAGAGPVERVREAKQRMDAIKRSPEAMVALGVLGAMGVASSEIEQIGVDVFTRKATFLVTNVPGPPAPIHLAGGEIESLLVWAPASGHVGIGCSLLSYAGHVRLGISADAKRMPDPGTVARGFEAQFEELVRETGC
ncbi:MAG: wax ester/triacylglycerol synthase domain-containing protein [Myxococcota bacterium]